MKTARKWWMYAAAALCVAPLIPLMPGCKGSYSPSGGPTAPTPRATATPNGTPRPTATGVPGSTPGATPAATPGATPSNTPFTAPLVGNFAGSLTVDALAQVSRPMTIVISADNTASAEVTLTNGSVLNLTGTANQTSRTITLTGDALVAGVNTPIAFTLTGLFTTSAGNVVSGTGSVTDPNGDTGTWSARKTG